MKIQGKTSVPGDKSISHRALLISALAQGTSQIVGLNYGDDVVRTLEILQDLGVQISYQEGSVFVEGKNLSFKSPHKVLDCGNSGTTMRLMAGVLGGQSFESTLDGDFSLRQRPMGRIIDPLSLMGCKVHGAMGGTTAPLTIFGGDLQGIHYELPVPSAQVKSALLLAGLQARDTTTIIERIPSRDHTERMLQSCGAPIVRKGNQIEIVGGRTLQSQIHVIPGDFSSAAFLIGAAVGLSGSELIIEKVGLNPTRLGFLTVLQAMGAHVEIIDSEEWGGEPVGDLLVRGSTLTGVTVEGELIPLLLDEIPILAVLATQALGRTMIRDAGELRLKESDRLASLTSELTKLGAQIVEQPEGLEISGPTKLWGAKVHSHGDHRLALALEVAALFAEGKVEVHDRECGAISFPGFSQTLHKIIVG